MCAYAPHLHDLLGSVRRELLKVIHVTDEEVEDVRRHQRDVLVGVLREDTHTQVRSLHIFISLDEIYNGFISS